MSEVSYKNLLLEEYKNAYEHIRYVEAKRDKYVPGAIVASGTVLVLIIKIFSKEGFIFADSNIWFVIILCLLCAALGLLSCFLRQAFDLFTPVIEHYENTIAVARSYIYGDKAKSPTLIKGITKPMIHWLNTRDNDAITSRRTTLSKLSLCVLRGLSVVWFSLAITTTIYLIVKFCC